jgi:hypothetical protein
MQEKSRLIRPPCRSRPTSAAFRSAAPAGAAGPARRWVRITRCRKWSCRLVFPRRRERGNANRQDTLPSPARGGNCIGDPRSPRWSSARLERNQEIAASAARLKPGPRTQQRRPALAFFPAVTSEPPPSARNSVSAARRRLQSISNSFAVPVDFSYELDVWGKVRRQVESATASEAAAGKPSTPCASASPARSPKRIGPCAPWMPTAPCSHARSKSAAAPSTSSPNAATPAPSADSTSPAPKPKSPPPRPTASGSIKPAPNS